MALALPASLTFRGEKKPKRTLQPLWHLPSSVKKLGHAISRLLSCMFLVFFFPPPTVPPCHLPPALPSHQQPEPQSTPGRLSVPKPLPEPPRPRSLSLLSPLVLLETLPRSFLDLLTHLPCGGLSTPLSPDRESSTVIGWGCPVQRSVVTHLGFMLPSKSRHVLVIRGSGLITTSLDLTHLPCGGLSTPLSPDRESSTVIGWELSPQRPVI